MIDVDADMSDVIALLDRAMDRIVLGLGSAEVRAVLHMRTVRRV